MQDIEVVESIDIQVDGQTISVEKLSDGTYRKPKCLRQDEPTPEAEKWDGWGTALKPSHEDVIITKKPHPEEDLIQETNQLVGGLVCLSLLSANSGETILTLNPAVLNKAMSVSVASLVSVLHGLRSGELQEKMDMSNLPERASMSLNIATLWNSILEKNWTPTKKSTISTETDLITVSRTLKSLILANIPNTTIRAVTQRLGSTLSATTVENSSQRCEKNTEKQSDTSVTGTALRKTLKSLRNVRDAEKSLEPTMRAVNSVLENAITDIKQDDLKDLEPSREDILLFRKQREDTYVGNALEHGVSGLNIDGARIPISQSDKKELQAKSSKDPQDEDAPIYGDYDKAIATEPHDQGRWPTNTVLGHHPECEVKCHDDCAVKRMDESSGESKSPDTYKRGAKGENVSCYGDGVGESEGDISKNYGDEGGASRFFKETNPPQSAEDWNCHPDCAVRRMDESSGELYSASAEYGTESGEGSMFGTGYDGIKQDNNRDASGGASRFFYCSKAQKSEREAGLLDLKDDPDERVNTHPCIKPIDLCEWIATLILPPPRENGERKILVPFSGTGSEVIGCLKAGWDKVIGIEISEEYCEIAKKRIEWWEDKGDEAIDKHKSMKKRKKKEKQTGQKTMFD